MASHSSARVRTETPHASRTRTNTIVNALKRRALAVLNDRSIDPQSRAIIRYALETNDPWLAELVRRADTGDTNIEQLDFSQTPDDHEDYSSDAKIEACVELICKSGSKATVALLVLMATLERATHPKAVANVAKHLVFTSCAESNINGMVDSQIATLESELLRE